MGRGEGTGVLAGTRVQEVGLRPRLNKDALGTGRVEAKTIAA